MKALAAFSLLLAAVAQGQNTFSDQDLQIYFIDVEGGQATLIVTPAKRAMLVDAGWSGYESRDADRIVEAMRLAGARQIDYLLMTHYHRDHAGGIPELARKVRIVNFADHGPNTEKGEGPDAISAAYRKLLPKNGHMVVKPGDRIPLPGLDVRIVTAAGQAISSPLESGGAPNPACRNVQKMPPDKTENAQSAGFVLSYGKFRFADFGDLSWNKELQLACPNDLTGPVGLFLMDHHGGNDSNPPALLAALRPKAVILGNGAHKGGSVEGFKALKTSPGLEDLWQLHSSLDAGAGFNAPEEFIANLDAACTGRWIGVTAGRDGSFRVLNSRNNNAKYYHLN